MLLQHYPSNLSWAAAKSVPRYLLHLHPSAKRGLRHDCFNSARFRRGAPLFRLVHGTACNFDCAPSATLLPSFGGAQRRRCNGSFRGSTNSLPTHPSHSSAVRCHDSRNAEISGEPPRLWRSPALLGATGIHELGGAVTSRALLARCDLRHGTSHPT